MFSIFEQTLNQGAQDRILSLHDTELIVMPCGAKIELDAGATDTMEQLAVEELNVTRDVRRNAMDINRFHLELTPNLFHFIRRHDGSHGECDVYINNLKYCFIAELGEEYKVNLDVIVEIRKRLPKRDLSGS